MVNICTEVNESNKKLLKLHKSSKDFQRLPTFKNKTLFKNICRYNIEEKSTQSTHVDKRSHV